MNWWQGWLSSLAALVAFIGSLTVVYTWAAQLNWRWDASAGQRFTLSPYTRQVLARLRQPLRIVGFAPSGAATGHALEELLRGFARESPLVKVEMLDTNRNPERARRYGVNTNVAVVVEGSKRRRIVAHPTELAVSAAIAAVHRKRVAIAYWQCPDGERVAYSRARHALGDEGFEVREWDGTQPVPEDAEVVAVCAIEHPPAALARNLEQYVGRGGRVLLLVEPQACNSAAPLCSWLSTKWGLALSGESIVDPASRLAAGDPYTIPIPGLAGDHPVTAVLNKPPLFSGATMVRWMADDVDEQLTGWVLLSTAPSSRAVVDEHGSPGDGSRSAVAAGPLPVAVALVGPGTTGREARIIVVGDTDFAADGFLEFLGNRDFLLNAFNWLVDEVDLLGVRPAVRAEGLQQFFLSAAQARQLLFWAWMAPSACLFLAALLVWHRRRRRNEPG